MGESERKVGEEREQTKPHIVVVVVIVVVVGFGRQWWSVAVCAPDDHEDECVCCSQCADDYEVSDATSTMTHR